MTKDLTVRRQSRQPLKKLLSGLFLIGLVLLLSSRAWADCLDKADVEEVQQSLVIRPPIAWENLCQKETSDYQLLSTLIFLKKTTLPKTRNPLDKNRLPENIWQYLTSWTREITRLESCSKEQMAFVSAEVAGTIHLCPDFFNLSMNLPVERAATLIHEARHLDKTSDHRPHVTCTQGRGSSQKGACDESLEFAGGYAYEAEVLVRLAALKENQLSILEKEKAKNAALVIANEKFNKPIFGYELRGLYVVDMKGDGYILDPHTWSLLPVRKISSSQNIISRLSMLIAFPMTGENSYGLSALSQNLPVLPSAGSYAASFDRLPKNGRPRVVRIFNESRLTGFAVTEDELISYAGGPFEERSRLPFRVQNAFTSEEAGIGTSETLFLLDDRGNMHAASTIYGRLVDIKPATNFLQKFKTIVFVNGNRVALSREGQLLVETSSTWMTPPSLQGIHFKDLTVPFYWASFLYESGREN